MATVKELRAQAKARKIPRYYSLSKSQLMYSLGINGQSARPLGDARARSTTKKHGIARSFAAGKIGEKLGEGDETKKAAIKNRIVKSVSKELKAHEQKIGRKLTIEEKRSVAVKALASEVRAIRSGVPEQKQRRKPAAERKAAQNQRHDAIDKDLNAKRQKVHEKAIASGKSEAEAAQVAYQTVKPRSIVREALAKKQAEQDAIAAKSDAYVPSSTQEAIAAKADAKKGKKKSKSEDAPLNDRDLKKAIYQRFEVKTQAQLLKSGNFKMATSGMAVKGKGFDPKSRESWEDVHRKTVGILPEEKNETGPHIVNGINVMKYDMPWKAFGLNPKTATGEEIKRTAKKILAKHHPDNGGDPAVFDRLHQFYQSIKPREW